MAGEKIILVKIKRVVGFLYLPETTTTSAIIYLKGGPSLGDNGKSPLWAVVRKFEKALFIPDYIGYCRSDGNFNFKNCVETIFEVKAFLTGKTSAVDCSTGETLTLDCKDIILVGSSWGSAVVPFVDKYKKSGISKVGLIKPVTDWVTQGKTRYREEDVIQTIELIKRAWRAVYRGIEKSKWGKIFAGDLREFNPIDNLELLKDKKVCIAHGAKDKVVNWRKSFKFYKELKKVNKSTYWKLFEKEEHGDTMTAKGLRFVLQKLASLE